MKLQKQIYLLLVFLTLIPVAARAEESGETFTLPETPPTIERKKMPPLDKPLMQKQDFLPEAEIDPPAAWHGDAFRDSAAGARGAEISFSRGSFESAGGGFRFSADGMPKVEFRTFKTAGEVRKLSQESSEMVFGLEGIGGNNLHAGIEVYGGDKTFWTQKKRRASGTARLAWYPHEKLNFKAFAKGSSAEIVEMQSNDNAGAGISAAYNPWSGHTVSASFASEKDTSFDNICDFSVTEVSYGVLALDSLSVKAGARSTRFETAPAGEIAWVFLPRTRLSVNYGAGTRKPDWADLYYPAVFARVEPSLKMPEAPQLVEEKLSYFFQDSLYVSAAARQSKWKNYIFWSHAAGTDYIAPENFDGELTFSETEFECSFKRGFLGIKASASGSDSQLPFVPELKWGAGAEVYLPYSFTIGAGVDSYSERKTSAGGSNKLPSFTDMKLFASKRFASGLLIFAEGSNLAGNKYELQPGFAGQAAEFRSGITAEF